MENMSVTIEEFHKEIGMYSYDLNPVNKETWLRLPVLGKTLMKAFTAPNLRHEVPFSAANSCASCGASR